jgi:hypothetical protein
LLRNKYDDDSKFIEESRKQLLELGYSIAIINEWLDNI